MKQPFHGSDFRQHYCVLYTLSVFFTYLLTTIDHTIIVINKH